MAKTAKAARKGPDWFMIFFVVAIVALAATAAWKIYHRQSSAEATAQTQAPAQQNVAGPFPEFSLQAASEKTEGPAVLTREDLKGHKTVFVIFRPSCPHCRNEAETLSRLRPEFDSKMQFVLASIGIKEDSLDFGRATGMTSSIYLGAMPVAQALGIQTVPSVFFLDEQGKIRHVQMGEKNDAAEHELLKSFAEGREIPQDVGL